MSKTILTIGGSDPFAGGGIQSDLKTFENFQLFGLSVLTSLGTIDSNKNFQLTPLPIELIKQQFDSVKEVGPLSGIKIGLLQTPEAIELVAQFIKDYPEVPIVLDPVFAFKETDTRVQGAYIQRMIDQLFPLVDCVTPNLIEAELLSGVSPLTAIQEMKKAASVIASYSVRSVVIKGGQRLPGEFAIDGLYDKQTWIEFSGLKTSHPTVNGAGCTFSSAITANLVLGYSLEESVERSKRFVFHCIENGILFPDGTGSVWSGGKTLERSLV